MGSYKARDMRSSGRRAAESWRNGPSSRKPRAEADRAPSLLDPRHPRTEEGVEQEPERAVSLAAVLGREAEEDHTSVALRDFDQRRLALELLGPEEPAALEQSLRGVPGGDGPFPPRHVEAERLGEEDCPPLGHPQRQVRGRFV